MCQKHPFFEMASDPVCWFPLFTRRHYIALAAKSRVEEATPDYATWSRLGGLEVPFLYKVRVENAVGVYGLM